MGIGSILVFARDGLHIFIHDSLDWILTLTDSVLSLVLNEQIIALLEDILGVRLDLEPHWRQATAIIGLGLLSCARSLRAGGANAAERTFSQLNAYACALVGGLFAGTIDISDRGMLPIFAVTIAVYFLFQSIALPILRKNHQSEPDLLPIGVLLPCLCYAAILAGYGVSDLFSETVPAPGLLGFALTVLAVATYFAVVGAEAGVLFLHKVFSVAILSGAVILFVFVPGAQPTERATAAWNDLLSFISKRRTSELGQGSDSPSQTEGVFSDPGRQAGLSVLATAGIAFLLAGLSQFVLPTTPVQIESPSHSVATVFRDCEFCPDMVVVPAGYLSEALDTSRSIADQTTPSVRLLVNSFAIQINEVTVREFDAFITDTGFHPGGYCDRRNLSWQNPGFSQSSDHPVVCVSWWEATAYARWLSMRSGIEYRLPTNGEWEHAARAGTSSRYFWGNEPNIACVFGNVPDRSFLTRFRLADVLDCEDGFVFTAAVGSFRANPWGLYDMVGNVSELSSERGFRGGGFWMMSPRRPGDRYYVYVDPLLTNPEQSFFRSWRLSHVGFRLARSL